MKIPKIKFKAMSLDENIDLIKWAYYENGGVISVHDFTINCFPELSNLDKNLSKKEVYKIIEEVVKNNYENNQELIKQDAKRYNNLWEKYNDSYFEMLSNYLCVSWPDDLDIIEGTIGIIPVFPRNLNDFSFSISPGLEDDKLIEVCAHETLHFLWFEKWKKIYPETSKKEYESPFLVWQYSEMVTDPILNNKPFSNIFDFREYGYDSFYELYDNDTLVMDNLRSIYKDNLPINDKINKGYEYMRKVISEKESSKK